MIDYLARALQLVAEQPAVPAGSDAVVDQLRRLCAASAQGLSASGAAISVLAERGTHGVTVARDAASERIEEWQLLLGEGPCVDAVANRRPVLVSDLDTAAMSRWPLYCSAVRDAGVGAVFAFPLQVGAAMLGVFDVYRTCPGPLSAGELAQALTFADVAVAVLLQAQDSVTAGTGTDGWGVAVDHEAVLFQAQGMVMVQLAVTLAEAVVRMRAYAFAQDRRLVEVARDIVTRTVSFTPER